MISILVNIVQKLVSLSHTYHKKIFQKRERELKDVVCGQVTEVSSKYDLTSILVTQVTETGVANNSDLNNDFWSIFFKSWCPYHVLAEKGRGTEVN